MRKSIALLLVIFLLIMLCAWSPWVTPQFALNRLKSDLNTYEKEHANDVKPLVVEICEPGGGKITHFEKAYFGAYVTAVLCSMPTESFISFWGSIKNTPNK
jgi:hypothetical protein